MASEDEAGDGTRGIWEGGIQKGEDLMTADEGAIGVDREPGSMVRGGVMGAEFIT